MPPAVDKQLLREQGNAAFKAREHLEGRYEDALCLYDRALKTLPNDAGLLCNCAVAHLRLGDHRQALKEATRAEQLLRGQDGTASDVWLNLLAKACFIQSNAALEIGKPALACSRLAVAAKLAPYDTSVSQKLNVAFDLLSAAQIAQLAAHMIESAEVSGNVSSRDGLLMKRLPEGSRFGHRGLVQYLQDAIMGHETLVRSSLSAHFGSALAATHGTRGRHVLYALRSMALVKAAKPALALKDACAALAFADGDDLELVLAAHAAAAVALADAEPDIGAVAHVRCGAADIDVEPRTAAAMSLHQLTQLIPGNAKHAEGLARCVERMPAIHGRVLLEESTPGICLRIKQERDAMLPEFKRSRPKYAAYFTWMSQRIEERYPGMEQCAIDKLLCMDSGELDLLLQPQNKDMDAAALLAAADKGIDWKTFQALASAETAHMIEQ